MKKLLVLIAVLLLTSGCALLDKNADKIEKYCDKAAQVCPAVDVVCQGDAVGQADCDNLKQGCALAIQACLQLVNSND